MIKVFLAFLLVLLLGACSHKITRYPAYDENKIPIAPDYSQIENWAAHPEKEDLSDLVPDESTFSNEQERALADVFFLHPTIYWKKHNKDYPWHGDVRDVVLNGRVDESTIKNQASIFNGSARVYAPRYRQAHLDVFYIKNEALKEEALEVAYQDAKAAFQYYLEHFNDGRPIIIASHSQGTIHAARLIKEFFEGKALQEKLVAAYLAGIGLDKELFTEIPACQDADETGCWMSWNTYKRNYYPPDYEKNFKTALSTNPLNWKIDDTYAPASLNKGGVLYNFDKVREGVNDAQNHEGLLWISKPKFFGNFLYFSRRYHAGDYNLFYSNIRENVRQRVNAYFERN